MSTAALPGDVSKDQSNPGEELASNVLWKCIEALASLKLTCALFLLGMVVVFIGSLAQARKDVWLVVHEYFRTYLAWVDVADLFPPSMFSWAVDYDWSGELGALRYIPFPGGWTIGWIMLANLLTAHYLRFRVLATGSRRFLGGLIVAIGVALTWAVVWTGNQQTGVEYGDTILSPIRIWYLMLGVMAIATLVPLGAAFFNAKASRPERILMASIGSLLGGVLLYFLIGGESARLNLSSMRILWQLLKGTACAIVMLIGCNMLFEKRGGIVLLHLGVALLMFSELQVGFYAKENLLALQEGEKLSYMRDVRERELAVMHRVDGEDTVVAIPESRLVSAAAAKSPEDKLIDFKGLPFVVRVDSFLRNSQLRSVMPGEDKTTTGLGKFATAVEIDPVTGMDDSHDMSSIQLALLDRESGEELETLLCSQNVSEMRTVPIAEQVKVDNKDYQFYLRFQRNYKDYEVELLDVSRTNYVGSSTPRDFRSKIVITDQKSGAAEEFTLWMNNPLRYKGETFYQSGYNELPNGTEMTTLSVVRNTGWMLPYIACMIVAVGMFAQFGQTLVRYLTRLDRTQAPVRTASIASSSKLPEGIRAAAASKAFKDTKPPSSSSSESSAWSLGVPIVVVLLSVGWLAGKARPPKPDPAAMNLYGFAQLPVAWKGRAQPVDSFARTELLMASHKSTFKGELSAAEIDIPENREEIIARIKKYWPSVDSEELDDFSGEYNDWIQKVMSLTSSGRPAVEERLRDVMVTRMPAVRWFLDVVARPDLARRHRVIKIDDDQVLSLLELEKRAGLAYSVEEIQKNLGGLEKINRDGLRKQMAEQEHQMSQLERRVVSLFQTVGRVESFQSIFLVRESEGMIDSMVDAWWVLGRLGNSAPVMAVPTGVENEQRSWETLIAASAIQGVRQQFAAAGLENTQQVSDYIANELPKTVLSRQMITDSVSGSLDILAARIKEQNGGQEATGEELKTQAMVASRGIEEPYLSKILEFIGVAEAGASVEKIMEGVSDEEITQMAAARISSDLIRVFQELQANSDKRLSGIRSRLQQIDVNDEDALSAQMNVELVKVALDDLDERVGDLVYGEAEAFDKGTESMINVLTAWSDGDVEEFNANVDEYQTFLDGQSLPHMDPKVIRFEAFFNFFEPVMKSIYLYLPVLIVSFLSWIVWPKTLRRSGFWLMGLAFVVHTVALLMRMYISGRPPVTNLYSSAIFIGWAVVGASFAIEKLLKNGIGNILGASVGMGTLVIAHYLARDEGDTMGVMQAVLDTTFWLATHVVCITLGYAATFLAGALGIAYCCMSMFGREKDSDDMVSLGKIVYGVLCFAVFFSLVGTVLGGLWADDSWGRFWGWDPKENGAMLIVMWNAVILHARWDKLVRDYGTAVLAVFGNIVTAWSWFGVNELKAGLHTYGFTEGRLLALAVFVALNAIFIAGAMIPVFGKSANEKINPA